MGCGNSYKQGRCEDGSDVENCVYMSVSEDGTEHCKGLLKFVMIPPGNLCKE